MLCWLSVTCVILIAMQMHCTTLCLCLRLPVNHFVLYHHIHYIGLREGDLAYVNILDVMMLLKSLLF